MNGSADDGAGGNPAVAVSSLIFLFGRVESTVVRWREGQVGCSSVGLQGETDRGGRKSAGGSEIQGQARAIALDTMM